MADSPPSQLVLASASPRRRQLLTAHGYKFTIDPAHVEEGVMPHLTGAELTLFHARAKSRCVARRHPSAVVIGADTLVCLEGRPLGKPRDMEDARAMLRALRGRTHQVFSGVWLEHLERSRCSGLVDTTNVRFRRLTNRQIDSYLARINPLDKAGGYAAQEEGLEIIEWIEGSFTNVVGLPMDRLRRALEDFGL